MSDTQVAAGEWRQDPTGRHELRFYNEDRWTDHISDKGVQGTDPYTAAGGGAPTKICPRCGAMNQTTSKRCPSCGKGYKRHTVLKVLLGFCLVGVLFIVGCSLLVTGAANELDKEQKAHAISGATFASMKIGWSESRVVAEAGRQPEDRQEFQSKSFVNDEPNNSSCIYYNHAGGSFGDVFQLCFDNGHLTSKNSY